MLQLSPAESFPIVRVLKDPSDTATHYVQAVIRDATTDALLATVNLDDKGNRRFQKVWKVIWDDTYGKGKYLVITTSVYDDSEYTTLSPNYAEEADTYLVQQRWDLSLGQGGGGGSIDEAFFKKVITEVLDGRAQPEIEIPDPVDTASLRDEILSGVEERVTRIVKTIPEPPEPEDVDLSKLESGVTSLLSELKTRPQFEHTDLTPLVRAIDTFRTEMHSIVLQQSKETKDYFERLKEDILMKVAAENIHITKFLDNLKSGSIHLQLGDSPEQAQTKKKKDNYLKSIISSFK